MLTPVPRFLSAVLNLAAVNNSQGKSLCRVVPRTSRLPFILSLLRIRWPTFLAVTIALITSPSLGKLGN
jgi:hypothetical protein